MLDAKVQELPLNWQDSCTDSIYLRPITEGDLEFLYRLYLSTREQELAVVPLDDSQKAVFLRVQFSAQHARYTQDYMGANLQVILEQGCPIGRFYVHRRPFEIRIVDIALLPHYRNRGIESSLMSEMLTEARRRRLPVTIQVESLNPARRLYERLGFRPVKGDGIYQLMKWMPEEDGEGEGSRSQQYH